VGNFRLFYHDEAGPANRGTGNTEASAHKNPLVKNTRHPDHQHARYNRTMRFYFFSNLCAALALANVASATDLFQGDGTDGGNQSIVGGTVVRCYFCKSNVFPEHYHQVLLTSFILCALIQATVGRYSYTVALSANGQFCGMPMSPK
jgi:hypothetical protein